MLTADELITVKKWAVKNNCEIDEDGILHVFKAVHKVNTKNGPRYIADFCVRPFMYVENKMEKWIVMPKFLSMRIVEYKIGEIIQNDLDCNRTRICAIGLHCSTIGYSRSFGMPWGDMAIIECGIDIYDPDTDIVIPFETCFHTEPKIRTNKLKVIREVECTTGQWHPKTGLCFIFDDQEKAWCELLRRLDDQ